MTGPAPICMDCKHYHFDVVSKLCCDAFPRGIPDIIIEGGNNHETPLKYQRNKFVFEPLTNNNNGNFNDLNRSKRYESDRKPRRCPKCKSTRVLKIIYGMPTYEAYLEAQAGKFALGGCCISVDNPSWECFDCKTEIFHKSLDLPNFKREV